MPPIAYLECTRCHAQISAATPQTVCPQCPTPPAGSLYVRYDLSNLKGSKARDVIAKDAAGPWAGMWRYRSVLPEAMPVTLGEGWTPMLKSTRHPGAYVKEEGANPTGTFKARGLAMAVTMAKHYGLRKLAVPSAGNAAGALAAYAAAAGIEAHIFMPIDVPFANYVEAVAYGAHVELVDGLISDCARIVQERKQQEGWFDISTLKEPFRVEGKKTMGYELVEQLGWEYPDAVFYPTGGGVGLIGMWKAFEELEAMHLLAGRRPRMVAAQAEGCAPIVRAFQRHARTSERWDNASTVASGLRVPKALGDFLILEDLYASGGDAVAASDAELMDACQLMARLEGIFAAPESGAGLAAIRTLVAAKKIARDESIVLFSTGGGYKYFEAWQSALR
jgi:threonine synthase